MHMYKPAQAAFAGWALAGACDRKVKGNVIKNLKCCAEAVPVYYKRRALCCVLHSNKQPYRKALRQTGYLLL